jgi:phage baseplate assembly protein W
MAKKQLFGIKYPFIADDVTGYYVAANKTVAEKVRSQLMHIIFTPKGQRIRNPEFGTDLIKYIFDQNDGMTWEAVKTEVSESVTRWATNINLKDIRVVKSEEDPSQVFVRLDYSVTEGNKTTNDSVVVEL